MIFLEMENNELTGFRHFQPFDKNNGLGESEDQLLQRGILVESIPEPEDILGKESVLKFNGSTLYYEYVDRPLSSDEEISILKEKNQELKDLLTEEKLNTQTALMELAEAAEANEVKSQLAIMELAELIGGME